DIIHPGLPVPIGSVFIMGMDILIKLPGDPSDGNLVSNIGGSQSPRSQSADPPGWLNQQHRLIHARALYGGRNARRSGPVDDDVVGRGSRILRFLPASLNTGGNEKQYY